MKVKKKSVIVDAIKWTGENLREIIDLIGMHESAKKWTWDEYCAVVRTEGLKIFTLEGTMMASIGDYIIKGVNGEAYPIKPDIYAKTYDEDFMTCGTKETVQEQPAFEAPDNRLLNAFPRPEALNEIYSTGDVDYRGVPANYSIWRGNHSIMGMTGILFQKGTPGDFHDPETQEGVEDTDLLEMVHDRLVCLRKFVAYAEFIDYAIECIKIAIKGITEHQEHCRGISDTSGC